MKDVLLKATDNQELESVLPIDRVVTIDDNNVVYLQDKGYVIEEKYIDKEI